MKKKVELTYDEMQIVKLNERRCKLTFKGCYLENGVRTWYWEANEDNEFKVDLFGKDKRNKKN